MTLSPDVARLSLWFVPMTRSLLWPWVEWLQTPAEAEAERYAAEQGFHRELSGRWVSAEPRLRRSPPVVRAATSVTPLRPARRLQG
ncbi:MAG TPA: hypothetical protein VN668_10825 [Stellaceae bacterium]|nr:hypothetical protein [Stellaceae bacterium]